jgi:pimeloyl-ACP methyl ester carboxylesterase
MKPDSLRYLARAAMLFVAVASSCASPVGIRRVDHLDVGSMLTASALNQDAPSDFSRNVLYRYDLGRKFKDDPEAALAWLHAGLGGPDETFRLFSLAELSYLHAERSGDRRWYIAAAIYAYAYLFPESGRSFPSRYDSRTSTALEIYNRAIVYGLSPDKGDALDLSDRDVQLPFATVRLRQTPEEFHLGDYHLTDFIAVGDFEVRGLRNRYRSPGIGASLAPMARATDEVGQRWVPPRGRIPLTMFLRFPNLREQVSEGTIIGEIELYDVYEKTQLEYGPYKPRLAVETSATLAYRLEGAPIWDFEIAGFRGEDFTNLLSTERNKGLFFLQPYYPGRIPVVFVHGTASSPARWAQMTNELLGDPQIGRRFQFWYFMYNTGNPIPLSAANLREALIEARHDIDPEGKDAALDNMVVLGHSQGGLLTRLAVSSSEGDTLWKRFTGKPHAEAGEMGDSSRTLLERSLIFEPVPSVRRVIFIATPHRGSFLAANPLSNLTRRLIALPATVLKATADVATLNPGRAATKFVAPTAIDNMRPGSRFLKNLETIPMAPDVPFHSICAVKGDGPPAEGNDGVVEYTSAHLDGAVSELVVRSAHSTQETPATIEEVRRILYQHIGIEEPQQQRIGDADYTLEPGASLP